MFEGSQNEEIERKKAKKGDRREVYASIHT